MPGLAHIGKRAESDDSKAWVIFDKIIHSGNLLQGIINDIFSITRKWMPACSGSSRPRPISHPLGESLELMQERAVAKKLTLQLQMPTTCPRHSQRLLRLRQMLLNLLSMPSNSPSTDRSPWKPGGMASSWYSGSSTPVSASAASRPKASSGPSNRPTIRRPAVLAAPPSAWPSPRAWSA